MPALSPKKTFQQARSAEAEGKKHRASTLYAKLGLQLRSQRRFKEARILVRKALELRPGSARLQFYLSLCENDLGQPQRALHSIRKSAEIAARNRKLGIYRKQIEKQLQQAPELRAGWYEVALGVDRIDATHFLGLAHALMDLGDWAKAKEILLEGLKTKSNSEALCQALRAALQSLGEGTSEKHIDRYLRGAVSTEDLALLLSTKPRAPGGSARETARSTDSEKKDLDSLIHDLEQRLGISLDERLDTVAPLLREFQAKAEGVIGHDNQARLDLGVAYLEMGLYRESQEELRKVTSSDSLYPQARYLLGEVLRAGGSEVTALEAF